MSIFLRSKYRLGSIAIIAALAVFMIAGCGREAQVESVKAKPVDIETIEKEADKPDKSTASQPPTADNKPAEDNQQPKEKDGPQLKVTQQGVTLRWVEDGQLRMSATAREITGDEVTKTGILLDFSAQLYENGKLTASIRAPKAVADTKSRIVTATGGVILKSLERATTVRAEWIRWHAKEQKVVGNGGVKIDSTMGTMEAAAFVANTALKTLTLKDSAKGL